MPALLTRMSIRPKASTTLAMDVTSEVQVDGHGYRPPALAIEFRSGQMGTRGIEIGDGKLGTGAGEGASDLLANTACRTGDDGDPVLEAHCLNFHALKAPRSGASYASRATACASYPCRATKASIAARHSGSLSKGVCPALD